jgi:hypothetical protein
MTGMSAATATGRAVLVYWLTVGSQRPGTRRILSPSPSRLVAPEMPSLPCSSEARSSVERLITVAHTKKARLERLGRGAVMVEVAAVIGVHENVGASSQFGIDAARRFELEGAGAGPGDARALDAVARQGVVGAPSLVGGQAIAIARRTS